MPDTELAVLRRIARCIPNVPHATAVVNRLIKPWYLRRSRPNVIAAYNGLSFELNPAEAVDGAMLFYPHLYLKRERCWLEANVRARDIFVDAGAYLGAFALMAERKGARAFAIEASPETFERLQANLALNSSVVTALNVGLSDVYETRAFNQQRSGNAGGSSFLGHPEGALRVSCVPLADVVPECDVLKLDVEGMEYKVLSGYFSNCQPRVLILEAFGETEALRLCRSVGYTLADRSAENCLLIRSRS